MQGGDNCLDYTIKSFDQRLVHMLVKNIVNYLQIFTNLIVHGQYQGTYEEEQIIHSIKLLDFFNLSHYFNTIIENNSLEFMEQILDMQK